MGGGPFTQSGRLGKWAVQVRRRAPRGGFPPDVGLLGSPARRGSAAASGSPPNGERAPGEVGGGPRDPSASCRPRPLRARPPRAREDGREMFDGIPVWVRLQPASAVAEESGSHCLEEVRGGLGEEG